ncbi:acyl-CoA-binding domain-containing protein 6 [Leptinotarsa decemlineata]|uniref:acyl-CoA-binding domain-containing protein 6 n=1 Tax=Leptinotarsa decemlineata TaxID=7539 RepID=UPI003D30B97B
MASFVDNFSDLQELGINVSESNDPLSISFSKAADHLQKILPNVDNQTLLTLYGYYKQGTEGPCNTPKPSWYDIRSKAKWEAWHKLGDMPSKEAKTFYVENIKALDPSFEADLSEDPKDHWVKVSSMPAENIPSSDMTLTDYVKSGEVAEVEKLLKSERSKMNDLDGDGLALLHWATDRGNLDMIKVLVDAGADLGVRDVEGQTALHYACSCGHVSCVEYLLSKGADSRVLDDDGNSPTDVTTDTVIKDLLMT